MLFHAPRLEGIRVIRKRATKDGVGYTRLILDHRGHFGSDVSVETFALNGNSAGIRLINGELHKALTGQRGGWFDCVRMTYDSRPVDGDIQETLEPSMVTRRWLSIMHTRGADCGGAHPSSSSIPRTFNLDSGREVDLHDWFNAKAVKRERYEGVADEFKSLHPDFKRFVLSGWKPDDPECSDPIQTTDSWSIELTKTGFIFTPDLAHAVQVCEEGFLVPFAKLSPWLSAEGARNVAALRAEVGRQR